MQTIPINEVIVKDRMRREFGNMQGLMDSIQRIGLIEPIVLDQNKVLVAGGRRLKAHELLKKTEIKFVYSDDVPEDVKSEMEFEENFWRKNLSWQEEALGILNIYRQKKLKSKLEGWTEDYQQIISDIFQMSVGTVGYVLVVAKKLEPEKNLPEEQRRFWKFQSVSEAYRMGILADEQDRLNRSLEARRKQVAQKPVQQLIHIENEKIIQQVEAVEASPDLLKFERDRYESNRLNTIPFDQYWKEKQARVDEIRNSIFISNSYHCGDCIAFMQHSDNQSRFSHIITDPPYAIDIDYLNQGNPHGGLQDLERLRAQHQKDDNLRLLKEFFPAAWHCTKENAFVVIWCDISVWDFLRQQAEGAGFCIQSWPFIWRKVNQSIMNNAAGYNTSKDYEVAMICRKPSSVLAMKRNSSIVDASNTLVTKETGHPFAKPYEATAALIDLVSMKGQSILDPFMGGGSLIVQGLRMERIMFGCELPEPEAPWFNQAMTNIENLYYLRINPKYVFK